MTLEDEINKRKAELEAQRKRDEEIARVKSQELLEQGKRETEQRLIEYFASGKKSRDIAHIFSACKGYGITLSNTLISQVVNHLEELKSLPYEDPYIYSVLADACSQLGNETKASRYKEYEDRLREIDRAERTLDAMSR